MADWVTVSDVATELGALETDERLVAVTAASDAWCKRQRPDLDADTDPGASVKLAAVLYAAHLFRRRTAPAGFAVYSDLGAPEPASEAMTEVFRLLGNRRPVAR